MEELTAARWLVLDNLQHGWPYRTNLDPALADDARLWCVRNEYVRDGELTAAGLAYLAADAARGGDA